MATRDRRPRGPLILLALLAACGGAETHTDRVSLHTRVSVTVAGTPRPDFFDASDPRLLSVLQDTERLVGHPVEVAFHFAMLPRPRAYFLDDMFERTLRHLPRGLTEAAGWSPELWEWAAPTLRRIAIDYDGSDEATSIRFDGETGSLCVVLGDGGGLSSFAVADALRGAFWEFLARRYDDVGADVLPADERRLYALYLEEVAPRDVLRRRRDPLRAAHARAIAEGTVLSDRFARQDPELGSRLERWLLAEVRFFHDVSSVDDEAVQAAPPDAEWSRAVRLWSRWVVARFDRLPDAAQLALLEKSVVGSQRPWTIGTIDPLDLWQRAARRWIRAGSPRAEDANADAFPQALFEHAVCPWRPPVPDRSHPDEGIHCRRNVVYRWVLTDPRRFDRLIAMVRQADHPALTAAVVGSVVRVAGIEPAVRMWRALEASDLHGRVAARVVAEEAASSSSHWGAKRELWAMAARRWRAEPRQRGALLYLVALIDRPDGGNVDLLDWREFERLFGAPISRDELASFLAVGDRGLGRVPAIWPALGRGWSRVDAMVPAADALLSGREEPPEELTATLFAVIALLRQEGARDELGRLERWVRRRVAEHPAEAVSWVTVLSAVGRSP